MSSRREDLPHILSHTALENSLTTWVQKCTGMAKQSSMSPLQLHPVAEEQQLPMPAGPASSFRPRPSRRIVSTRSSISLFSGRPKGGIIPVNRFEYRRKPPSLPPRSVQRMVEHMPLILTEKQATAAVIESHKNKMPTSCTFGESSRYSMESTDSFATAHTIHSFTSEQKQQQDMSFETFLTAPNTPSYMDFGMFSSRDSASHTFLNDRASGREYTDCPCSLAGSPCEAMCIFEEYTDVVESSSDTQVTGSSEIHAGTKLSRRLPNSPPIEVDAFGTDVEGATRSRESCSEPREKNNSWLEDEASGDEAESKMSPAKWRARRQSLKVLSWVSDSSIATSQDFDDSLEFATALAPSRPRLIQIPSRTNSICGSDCAKSSPSYANSTTWSRDSFEALSKDYSIEKPLSPPATPTHERYDSDKTHAQISPRKSHQPSCNLHASGFEKPRQAPDRTPRALSLTSEGVSELISMFESSVKIFPSMMLQLDSPSILLLYHVQSKPCARLHNSEPSSSSTSLASFPLSSCSTLHQHSSDIDESTTRLAILRHIFPDTSESTNFLRTALYAHILALNFLADILTPSSLDNGPVHFQPKALSTLGVIEPVEGQSQLYDRVVKVTAALRDCVGSLLDACCGKGNGDKTLLKALKEVVRLVESTSHGREMF